VIEERTPVVHAESVIAELISVEVWRMQQRAHKPSGRQNPTAEYTTAHKANFHWEHHAVETINRDRHQAEDGNGRRDILNEKIKLAKEGAEHSTYKPSVRR